MSKESTVVNGDYHIILSHKLASAARGPAKGLEERTFREWSCLLLRNANA